jgi:hypothetical protein
VILNEYDGKDTPNLRFCEANHYTHICTALSIKNWPDPDAVFEVQMINASSKMPFRINFTRTITAALGTKAEGQVTEAHVNAHFSKHSFGTPFGRSHW